MKKKGMIPEHHRKASEEKFNNIIAEFDRLTACGWIKDRLAYKACGYCADANGVRGFFWDRCDACKISTRVCCDSNRFIYKFSLFARFIKALKKGNRTKARKIAVKIRDYIKNDKPKETP